MLRITFILFLIPLFNLQGQTVLPDEFTEEDLGLELVQPIGISFDDEGIGYIWEKGGKVWTLSPDGTQSEEPLIDISEEVSSYGDHGLVDLALHPSFETTGLIYLYYVVDRHHLLAFGGPEYDPMKTQDNQASIGRVSSYVITKENGVPILVEGSNKIIFGKSPEDGLPILMTSHAVGSIVFGTDGSLLLTCGDGGSFRQADIGNAADTYHDQAIEDGIISENENLGSFRAMLLNSLNGKVLRIDPDTGEGIPSNPYYDPSDPSGKRSRIWSLGFRNPYKMVKIPETGSHFMEDGDPGVFLLGDVGSSQWEELNIIDGKGQWFGWPLFEGFIGHWAYRQFDVRNPEAIVPLQGPTGCRDTFYFKDLYVQENEEEEYVFTHPCDENSQIQNTIPTFVHINPALAYSNTTWNPPAKTHYKTFVDGEVMGLSILDSLSTIEGDIVDGTSLIPIGYNSYDNFPSDYTEKLFVADFYGFIYSASLNDQNQLESIEKFLETDEGITDGVFSPHDGCLYYTHIVDESIRRICYGGDIPPKIVATADKYYGASPLTVNFDASSTVDYFEGGLEFQWNFDDGSTSAGSTPQHTFISTERRNFNVELKVKDGLGLESTVLIPISINNTPPQAEIVSIQEGQPYSIESYNIFPLQAEYSDVESSSEDLTVEWRVDLHHDNHFHKGPIDTRESSFAVIEALGCGIESYWYRIHLTVSDPQGLTTHKEVNLYPYCGEPISEILEFEAQDKGQSIGLNWNIISNENVSKFIVEKTDEFLFQTLGEVIKIPNNNNYSYTDNAPFIGSNYYRLKVLNEEGEFNYSNILEVNFFPESLFRISPNPSDGQINIQVYEKESGPVILDIYSLDGKLLKEEKWDHFAGNITERYLSLDDLSSGVYFYLYRFGDKEIKGRLVIL